MIRSPSRAPGLPVSISTVSPKARRIAPPFRPRCRRRRCRACAPASARETRRACAPAARGTTMPASARARTIKSGLREHISCVGVRHGVRATMYAPRARSRTPSTATDPQCHGLARWRGPRARCTIHPRDRLSPDMTPTMRFLRPTARLLTALAPLAPASLAAQGTPGAGARGTVAFVDVKRDPHDGHRAAGAAEPYRDRARLMHRAGRCGGDTHAAGGRHGGPGARQVSHPRVRRDARAPARRGGRSARQDILFLYVANGVTTIAACSAHRISSSCAGPRRANGSAPRSSRRALAERPVRPDAETAARLVRKHKAAGYDLLKLHGG